MCCGDAKKKKKKRETVLMMREVPLPRCSQGVEGRFEILKQNKNNDKERRKNREEHFKRKVAVIVVRKNTPSPATSRQPKWIPTNI